jgi:hypothetical protein
MSTFRETAVPTTCAECGNRVLVPQGRPGLRLKCPKCGSVLKAPSPSAAVLKSAAPAAPPLGSVPTAAMAPSTDVGLEIDALLFGGLATDPPPSQPPIETLSHAIPPTEVPRAETPHPGVVAFDAPTDPDEYKLSAELGPSSLPPPLPSTAFAPPPHASPVTHGEQALRLTARTDLPDAAGSRMQHVIDAALASQDDGGDDIDGHGSYERRAERSGAIGDRLLAAKGEKFTPDAALADPRRAFLRGVFEFPFYLDVMPQWIKLAFALTIELTLAWWIVALTLSSSDGIGFGSGGIAIGSLLMIAPVILLGFVWIAMTWAVGSAIIEDTAAGMNHIENWPESLVLDDLPSLVFPAFGLFLSALPGVGINWLSEHGVPQIWFLAPVLAVLLFPFTFLSILETGSVFLPFSIPIFRCVYKRPGTWVWFYAESTAVVAIAAWSSAELWLKSEGSIWLFSFAAILATGAILIYFRLLGRLALVCANQAFEWAEDLVEDTDSDAEKQDDLQAASGNRE